MCRGFQQKEREVLKIKAFYVRLLFSSRQQASRDSLTLHFPPRVNGGPLEINGLNVRPDTPAFVTLHRVISADTKLTRVAMYGSRERVRVSEGLRFEIYASNAKVLKGTIRKDEEGENWRLDCTSQVEEEELLSEADVFVEVEGRVAVTCQKVEIASRGDKKKKRRRKCFQRSLEEIPEQREEAEDRDSDSDGCCSSCDCDGDNKAGWRVVDGGGDHCPMEEVEMDGVRWAVDVGIWALACLGVGYLVSKASCTRIIRQRRLFYFYFIRGIKFG